MSDKIKLSPCCQPAFVMGSYQLNVTLTSNIQDMEIDVAASEFKVASKKFSISTEDVYSVYPPNRSRGIYENVLPHVVLKRNTLPWEVHCFKNTTTPWLFLMVFSDDEQVKEQNLEISEALDKEIHPNIFIPVLSNLNNTVEETTDTCTVIDISKELFIPILPTEEEVKILTHCRIVKLDDKVTDGAVTEGKFSLLTSNRYPKTPTGDEPFGHTAYIVSLEGFEALMNGNRESLLTSYTEIRMIALYSWKFQSAKEPFDFQSLIKNMKTSLIYGQVSEEVKDVKLRRIIRRGYVPVNHRLREGSETVSWYRGPLISTKEALKHVKYHVFSDELVGYDPQDGMFDMSYAAAWQLGRMLGLQNATISKTLIQWRLSNKIKMDSWQYTFALKNSLTKNKSDLNGSSAEEYLKAYISEIIQALVDEGGEKQND